MKIKAIVKEDMPTYPDSTVKTNTLTTDGPIEPIATPVNADSKIDSQNDLAKTPVGTPAFADNTNMLTASADANTPHHSTEQKVGEPCSPELKACVDALIADGKPEDSAWAICRSKIGESTAPEYAGKPYTTNMSTPPQYGGEVGGPSRTTPPSSMLPDAGKLPIEDDTQTIVGTSVVTHGIMTGTTPVESLPSLEERKLRVKADLRAASAEDKAVMWEQKHDEIYKERIEDRAKFNQLQGTMTTLKERIETVEAKRDEALREMHNSQIQRDEWHSKYEHGLGTIEDLKSNLAKMQDQTERATEKYSGTLKTNLELSRKLTKANEDYLEVAKKLEETEEKLTTARTNAKKTLKLRI